MPCPRTIPRGIRATAPFHPSFGRTVPSSAVKKYLVTVPVRAGILGAQQEATGGNPFPLPPDFGRRAAGQQESRTWERCAKAMRFCAVPDPKLATGR